MCACTHQHIHTQGSTRGESIRVLAAWLCSAYLIRRIHLLPPRWRNNAGKSPFTDEPQYPTNLLTQADIFNLFFFCAEVGLSSIWQLGQPDSVTAGRRRCRATISYLLNRLFLDTMRRKPVGSVTELSLLLSSSNCWSNKSPASLSVSLFEHPLWSGGAERDGVRDIHNRKNTGKQKALEHRTQCRRLYIVSLWIINSDTCDQPEIHTVLPTHLA